MYHSKVSTYGPEYYAVSYGRVACMHVVVCVCEHMHFKQRVSNAANHGVYMRYVCGKIFTALLHRG